MSPRRKTQRRRKRNRLCLGCILPLLVLCAYRYIISLWYRTSYFSLGLRKDTFILGQDAKPHFVVGHQANEPKNSDAELSDLIRQRQEERLRRRRESVWNRNSTKMGSDRWWSALQEERTNVDDDGVTEVLPFFDYNRPAFKTEHTLPNPQTATHQGSLLVVLVLSARHHVEERQTIRETWGSDQAVYFIIGGPDLVTEETLVARQALYEEQETYRDLLDTIHPDSYRSLPHKLKFAYQWVVQHFVSVRWILKVDDDMYVRIDTLQSLLLEKFNATNSVVMGNLQLETPVHRHGPWAEHPLYTASTYPVWPMGSCGHLVTRPVADYVGTHASQLPIFQGEDVSLGVWLDRSESRRNSSYAVHAASLGIKGEVVPLPPLPPIVTWLSVPFFVGHGRCEGGHDNWLVLGHNLDPKAVLECHEWMKMKVEDDYDGLVKDIMFVENV